MPSSLSLLFCSLLEWLFLVGVLFCLTTRKLKCFRRFSFLHKSLAAFLSNIWKVKVSWELPSELGREVENILGWHCLSFHAFPAYCEHLEATSQGLLSPRDVILCVISLAKSFNSKITPWRGFGLPSNRADHLARKHATSQDVAGTQGDLSKPLSYPDWLLGEAWDLLPPFDLMGTGQRTAGKYTTLPV